MDTSPIFDYIENVVGVSPTKVIHVEDVLETHPENPDQVTCVYSLFSADFAGKEGELFVQIASSTANVALPADELLLQEFFPEYAQTPPQSDDNDERSRLQQDSSEDGQRVDDAGHPDGPDVSRAAGSGD